MAEPLEKKEKKIVVFISDLDCGGAQRVVIALLSGFLEQEYLVDLVVARGGGVLKSEVPEHVRVINLCDEKQGKYTLFVKSLTGLVKHLNDVRPDAVLSSITGANLVAVVAKYLSRSKANFVLRHENTGLDIGRKLLVWAVKVLYSRADSVVAVSSITALDLSADFGVPKNKLHVIENPVDTKQIQKKAKSPFIHSWFQGNHIPVLLAVGRLYPQKDFETLIKAFSLLLKERPVRLIILGEGPEREKLEHLIKQFGIQKSVDLPGIKQNPYPWMKAATLFVMSSRWEGFPVGLMEAMALGCKIVATDCRSGPRELLGGGCGILVPVGDIEALKNGLNEGLDLFRHIPEAVVSKAEEYSPENAVNKHLALLFGDGAHR